VPAQQCSGKEERDVRPAVSSFPPHGDSNPPSFGTGTVDDIFPVLPFSRREVEANNVRNLVDGHYGVGGRHVSCGAGDVRMMVSDFTFRRNASGPAMGRGYLKFHYKLSGRNVLRFANNPEVLIESGRSAVLLHPEGLTKEDCFAADVRELSVTVGCQRLTVLNLLGVSSDELPRNARRYFDGSANFCCDELPLSPQMAQVLYSLIKPSFAPWLQRLHVEAKVLELIGLSLQELTRQDFLLGGKSALKPRDIDMLHAVRQFLESNLGNEITINAVCEKFGTNRTKLSAGYKTLFGETLFEHLHQLRMDHAMMLLVNTQLPMSEVAEKVGYGHQSSFSTAFREHHGVSPLSARRSL
jgi:AraC-like DNA-binding protein